MNGEFDFSVCPICGSGRIEEEGATLEPAVSPCEIVTASVTRCKCKSCSCEFSKTVMKIIEADRFEYTLKVSGHQPQLMKKMDVGVSKTLMPRRSKERVTNTEERKEASQ